jgi:endonuclease YncB( thermonuclease family)
MMPSLTSRVAPRSTSNSEKLICWTKWLLLGLGIFVLLLIAGCDRQDPNKPPAGPYTVAEVFDGDSFNLNGAKNQRIRVRIAGIDAPEKGQPYSTKARESLEALLKSGEIQLSPVKKDRFDRWVSNVSVANQDIGLTQVNRGYAWFFRRYQSDLSETMQKAYADAEQQAKRERVGLWAGLGSANRALEPEPPWKYRERTRKER